VNRAGPGWLAEFQAHFGDVVRTPLDRSSGTLRATPDRYDAVMTRDARDGPRAPGAARLAVYNRQYWFRLFEVLKAAFPLTARLLGYWTFNGHAGRFLLQVPPRGWDIEAAGLGFVPFLEEELRPEDESTRVALLEAARIDAAWRDVSRAPLRPRYRPSDADATHLLESRLIPSEDLQLVEEHSALLELRRTLNGAGAHDRIALPPPLAQPRRWALLATEGGVRQLPLEEREAELVELLRSLTVREALARLEKACGAKERESLPAHARRWLARGVQHGYWSGIVRGERAQSQTTHV